MKIQNVLTRPILSFIDWYIRNYHSQDYIHRDMIKDEIFIKIQKKEKEIHEKRNEEEAEKQHALELEHQIRIDGLLAEIEVYKKESKEVAKEKKAVKNLYFELKRRAKELSLFTAENKHEGNNIIKNVASSIGQLDVIGTKTRDLVKEFDDNEERERAVIE